MKATSPILSHLLPATQAQGTSLIQVGMVTFLVSLVKEVMTRLSEPEDFMINKR